jgi:superfamily II DNA/RNA helicase
MNPQQIRDALRTQERFQESAFQIARSLCDLANDDEADSQVTRELLLRSLERLDQFGESKEIIEGLVREAGLFPYLDPERLGLADRLAFEFHRPPGLDQRGIVFHGPQARIYQELMQGRSVILSAPTSFGKSLIIDAVIASDRYSNILVVVPTIALIDETRRRLATFKDQYKVITHPFQEVAERNVFVLTQERALELEALPEVDFFVIDEFYKLSPTRDNRDRWSLLNQLLYKLIRKKTQFYMLGPSIKAVSQELNQHVDSVFVIEPYSTVVTEEHRVPNAHNEEQALINLCRSLYGPTIVFCQSPRRAATAAKMLSGGRVGNSAETTRNAVDWISRNYHPDWHFCESLKDGVAIHHGRIPRALAQFAVKQFNQEKIQFLVCTSTLIEGVNTKAENVIILDNQIDRTKFDFFTFNNIRGRSGRMFQHFVGHVYLFHEPPQEELPFVDIPAYSQGDLAPDSLLLQLDDDDLKPRSRDRLKQYADEGVLSIETLRANIGVEPENQLALAETILSLPKKYGPALGWRGKPSWEQLQIVCELIWNHFDAMVLGARSARSPKQLATRINQVFQRRSIPEQVASAMNFVPDRDPDLAVQSVLDFQRLWASFHFPKLLRALGRIQNEVLPRLGYEPGAYGFYAGRVETLAMDRSVFALDEYGIPLPLALKLEPALSGRGNLDLALKKLKALDVSRFNLHPFELELIEDARAFL